MLLCYYMLLYPSACYWGPQVEVGSGGFIEIYTYVCIYIYIYHIHIRSYPIISYCGARDLRGHFGPSGGFSGPRGLGLSRLERLDAGDRNSAARGCAGIRLQRRGQPSSCSRVRGSCPTTLPQARSRRAFDQLLRRLWQTAGHRVKIRRCGA